MPYTKPPFQYSNADRSILMNHVQKRFGTISGIGKTQLSKDRTLELLAVTPPSRKHIGRLFSTTAVPVMEGETLIITFGAGAFPMNVPKDSELPPRAEYLIRLPGNWNIQSEEKEYTWPARLLTSIASLPETEQNYNAWGHTFCFSSGTPFADNTKLCAAMLTGMNDHEGQCYLTTGESVIFYEVIPLYDEELAFTAEHGAEALIDEFIHYGIPRVVTLQRPNAGLLVKHRELFLQKLNDMTGKNLHRQIQQENLTPEEQIVLEELLHTKPDIGKRMFGLIKTLTGSFLKR